MNDASRATAESSLLLWFLSAALATLAAYVLQGWLRQGLKAGSRWQALAPLAIGSLTWGSVVCAATVLTLSGAALSFPIGFRTIFAPAIWAFAVLAALPAMAGMLWKQKLWMCLICGLLLAVATVPVQMGWFFAAGFRPGVVWRNPVIGAALLFSAAGFAASWWLGFSAGALEGSNRMRWRVGAAILMGLTLMAGQELVTLAAGLLAQVGSVYQYETPAPVLALIGGALLPLVLVLLVLDLEIRRRAQRRMRRGGADTFNIPKRRKRRHKTQSI